jgi:hypothetical protein
VNFVRDMWEDSKGLTIGLALVALAMVGLIGFGIFAAVAHVNGIHEGNVSEKTHHAAYTSVMCTGVKVHVCHPVFHPESWGVVISKEDKTNSFSLSHDQWDSVRKGMYLTFDGDTLASAK